jgi:hypothetical protein
MAAETVANIPGSALRTPTDFLGRVATFQFKPIEAIAASASRRRRWGWGWMGVGDKGGLDESDGHPPLC